MMFEMFLDVNLDTMSDIAGFFLPPSEGSYDHHVPSFYTFLLIFCQKNLSLLEIGLRELHMNEQRGSGYLRHLQVWIKLKIGHLNLHCMPQS